MLRNIPRGIGSIRRGVQRRNQLGSPNRGGAWLGQVVPAVRSAIGNTNHRARSSAVTVAVPAKSAVAPLEAIITFELEPVSA